MRVLIWIVLVAALIAIVVGSLISGMTAWPRGLSPGLTHLSAYTVLGALMSLAFPTGAGGIFKAFLFTALLGTAVEFLQMVVPVREFSLYDLGMNVIGAGLGVAIGASIRRWLLGSGSKG